VRFGILQGFWTHTDSIQRIQPRNRSRFNSKTSQTRSAEAWNIGGDAVLPSNGP